MNRNKFLFKIVTTTMLGLSLTSLPAYASDLGSTSTIVTEADGSVTITTENNKQVRKYSSTDTHSTEGFKATVDASFIDDSHSAEETVLLSLKGFISSEKEIIDLGSKKGVMRWPSSYGVDVSLYPVNNKEVKIVDSTPKNSVSTIEINNTMTYTIGGGVQISSGNGTGEVALSKSIKYNQPDYTTIQTNDSATSASWKTSFSSTKEGYDLNSWDPFFGNELFMISRTTGTSTSNFLGNDKLSSLISGGFSPNIGLALTAEKGTELSVIEVKLSRNLDSYNLNWIDVHWQGFNIHNVEHKEKSMFFEIDWVNHKVKDVTKYWAR